MCGIAGIAAFNAKDYRQHMARMLAAIQHRGPDEQGVSEFSDCILGHVRLSIVDIETGQQPMVSGDGLNCITLNGEIYGYKELKKQTGNYDFSTNSDTEVVLALYGKYGPALAAHLPGMFSFAVRDAVNNRLYCARDRFGEKPFYYATGKGNEFIFASEIKAIIASGLVNPVLDTESIAHYLKRLYIKPGTTIYKNIKCLPPAHYLIYQDGKIKIRKYWNLPDTVENLSLVESTEKFRHLFRNAISKQLVADVPVAAFLSGGLDSASIVSVASEFAPRLKTFTFNFGSIDETPYARQIAEKYGTDHTELHASDFDLAELLLQMQQVFDEPFADSSNIPVYLISKLAREHVKVVLTGEGGDELCGGYSFWYRELWDKLNNLQNSSSNKGSNIRSFLKNILRMNSAQQKKFIMNMHHHQNVYFHDEAIRKLMLKEIQGDDTRYDFRFTGTLNDAMNMDILNYMPGDVLVKSDRASLASALELRCPFLDKDLAEFCISLPSHYKIDAKEDKVILRKAFGDKWTDDIRKRPKQGFGAPVNKWLETDSFTKLKHEFLYDGTRKIWSVLDHSSCSDFFEKNNYNTWILLVLSLWMENHEFDI